MKASGLRLGNWVSRYGIPERVTIDLLTRLNEIEASGKTCVDITPLALDATAFLQMGFIKVGWEGFDQFHHFRKRSDTASDSFIIRQTSLYGKACFSVFNYSECDSSQAQYLTGIESVHELQNLYTAITGRELDYTP